MTKQKTTQSKKMTKGRRKDAATPIQMKVKPEVRKYIQDLAHKYFKKNMSALIRYAVYHCSYDKLDKKSKQTQETDSQVKELPQEAMELLTDTNNKINDMLEEMRRIGVNVNQVAKHLNESFIYRPFYITKAQHKAINDCESDVQSIKTSIGELRQLIIDKFTK